MRRPWTRRLREEGGFTLTELTIVATLLLIVTGAFLTVVENLHRTLTVQERGSSDNDQARLAVQQLDREIRSGNVLYDPALESDPYYTMRIYTQANATTRDPSFQCVQWRLHDRWLERRSWPPGRSEEVSAWRPIADAIVNRDLTQPAFRLDADPNKAGRTVTITLYVNGDLDGSPGVTHRIETSLTGRNTAFNFPAGVCDPVPA